MVGYLVAVVPMNLWILERLGKRDWAWLTIPVVSLVALTGFWMGGRQRLDSTSLRHATVVVAPPWQTTSSWPLVVGSRPTRRPYGTRPR